MNYKISNQSINQPWSHYQRTYFKLELLQ